VTSVEGFASGFTIVKILASSYANRIFRAMDLQPPLYDNFTLNQEVAKWRVAFGRFTGRNLRQKMSRSVFSSSVSPWKISLLPSIQRKTGHFELPGRTARNIILVGQVGPSTAGSLRDER